MSRKLAFTPRASADIEDAYAWYDAQRAGLGSESERERDVVFHFLEQAPDAGPVAHGTLHRLLVKRFSYAVYYHVTEARFEAACISAATRGHGFVAREVLPLKRTTMSHKQNCTSRRDFVTKAGTLASGVSLTALMIPAILRTVGNIWPRQGAGCRVRIRSDVSARKQASFLGFALPLVLAVSGCLGGFRVAQTPAVAPRFRPEEFFAGATHGEGVLLTRGKADRSFRVTGSGQTEGDGTFVLDQTIAYTDGAVERRSFRIRRVNDHDYTGTLTGASGAVSAHVDGNSFHVRYTIRKPAVTMEQWIYLQPDGRTALNRATVSVLGISVAHLSETITRE